METDKTAENRGGTEPGRIPSGPAEDVGTSSGPGYETRDANIRGLLIFAAGLFATLVLLLIVMAGIFRRYSETQSLGPPATPFPEARALPPPPRLQPEPRLDLEQLRRREDEILNSYGWVDPKAGVVRIPIDRAMSLLIQKGLPVRGTGQNSDGRREK